MSGVGSRETGLDSLFASNPVGPGFKPCLGQALPLPISQVGWSAETTLSVYQLLNDIRCHGSGRKLLLQSQKVAF